MAIALVGTPTTAEAASTTGVTVNVPTGVVDGNLLVWVIGQTTSTTIATPTTGWTQLQVAGNVAVSMHVWYRVASSEPASYTSPTRTASRCSSVMLAYSGVDTGTPWDVATPAFSTGTTAFAFPAITPTTTGAWVLGFASGNVGTGVTNTVLSSSNQTVDGQLSSTSAGSTNNVSGAGHFAWSSGAFTPAWTASNALVRTLGGSGALRPSATATVFPASQVRKGKRPPVQRRTRLPVVPAQVTGYVGVYNDVITGIPSLIGRWKLDDRSGAVAVATVGANGSYVATPTLAAAGLVSDGGTAVTTDGVASEITVPVGTGQVSIAFWSSHGAGGGAGNPIMRDSTSTAGTGWFIDISGVNPIVRADGTSHTVSTVTASTLRTGTRHFYVMQLSGSTVTFYIDGALVDTWTKAGATFPGSATNWHFGKNGTAANFYGGTFDDIGGFNSNLSDGQVLNLWLSGITAAYPFESRRTVTRRFVVVPRRGHTATVVPVQAAATPPPAKVTDTQRRFIRGFAARRRRAVEVTPAQVVVAPPTLVPDTRRRPRGFVARRRSLQVVPAQTTPPPYTPETRRRARGFLVAKRGRTAGVTPPQLQPPPDTRRRLLRGLIVERRGRIEVVPPQVVATPPPTVPETRRRLARGFSTRRRRAVEVTPPQVVVAPPSYVSDPRRRARGFLAAKRGRPAGVTPPQAPAPDTTRRRLLRGLIVERRGRIEVVPPQVAATPPPVKVTDMRRRMARGFATRRRRSVEVTPPQVAAAAPPPYVPTIPPKRVLRGVPRRGRRADLPPGQLTAPAPPGSRRTPPRRTRRRRLELVPDQPVAPAIPRRRPLRVLVRKLGRTAAGLFGATTAPAVLLPEEILTARVYPATLTADIHGGLTARTIPSTLTADTETGTLTAVTLPSTLAKD